MYNRETLLFMDIYCGHHLPRGSDLTPIESIDADNSDETGLQFSLSIVLPFGKIFTLETDGDICQLWV